MILQRFVRAALLPLLFAASWSHAKPHAAVESDKDRIRELLRAAFEERRLYGESLAAKNLAESTGDFVEQWTQLQGAAGHLARFKGLLQDVTRETETAYGISPDRLAGTTKGGPLNGYPIEWAPLVQLEEEVLIKRESPDGRRWYFRSDFPPGADGKYGEVAGHTFHSGDVQVAVDIFEMAHDYGDPGVIALTLYHEAIHFDDLASRGFRSTNEDLELRAYTLMRRYDSVIVGDSPRDPNWKKMWLDHDKNQREHFRDKVARHDTSPGVPTEEGNEARKEEFDTQQARLAQIRREEELIRERAAEQERQREAHRRASRAQPLAGAAPVVRMRPLAAFDSFGALKGLTQRACANPGSILQEEITRWFSWIPDRFDYSDQLPGNLEGCPQQLLTELLDYNSTGERGTGLNPSWLNGRARELQPHRGDPFPLAGGAPPPALSPAPAPPRVTSPPRQRDCDRFTKDGLTWVEVNCP